MKNWLSWNNLVYNIKRMNTDFNYKLLSISFGVVILNNILGHYFPPFSIVASPILFLIIMSFMCYRLSKQDYTITMLCSFCLLILNDVLIRIFAGGMHDHQGQGFIFLSFIISFLICFVYILIFSFMNIKENEQNHIIIIKRISILLLISIGLLSIYFLVISKI